MSQVRFEDLGLSGFTGAHKEEKNAFGRLLLAVDNGDVVSGDYILVEAVDRLGRENLMTMNATISYIVNAGIKIVTLDDGLEYNIETLNNGLLVGLIGKFQQANNYSKQLSFRVKGSWKDRRALAKSGVSVKMRTPFWLDSNFELIDEYADILRQIYKWYLLGDGQRKIQQRLTDLWPHLFGDGKREVWEFGLKNNKSKMVNPGTVKKWLSNPMAIGQWGDISGVYPPAIEQDLYYKVQNAVKGKIKRASKPKSYFIGGLAKCKCGSNITFVRNQRGKGELPTINGRCTKRGRNPQLCDNSNTLPAVVVQHVINDVLHLGYSKLILNDNEKSTKKDLIVIEGKISEVKDSIDLFISLLSKIEKQSGYTFEQIQQELEEKETKLQELISEKESVMGALGPGVNLSKEVESLFENKIFDDNPIEMNRLLQQINFAVYCDGLSIRYNLNGEEIEYKYLGFERAKTGENANSYLLLHQISDVVIAIPRNQELQELDQNLL